MDVSRCCSTCSRIQHSWKHPIPPSHQASTTYTCMDPDSRQVDLHAACQAQAIAARMREGGGGGGPQPFGRLPYDLAELAERCGAAGGSVDGPEGTTGLVGVTDFAVLPLISGGEVVGAMTLALHRCGHAHACWNACRAAASAHWQMLSTGGLTRCSAWAIMYEVASPVALIC